MNVLHVVLAALLLLGPLIAIHEFGHFWVARRLGVRVLVYSIGFGPALWRRTAKDGVTYQVCAIPLGGYVRMADEREGEVAPEDLPRAFNRQSPWRRMAIVAAGPLVNLLLAVLIFWVLAMLPSEQLSNRIGLVEAGSPAAQAGLHAGEQIVAVDGTPTTRWAQVNMAFMARMGESGVMRIDTRADTSSATVVRHDVPLQQFMRTTGQGPSDVLGIYPWQPTIPAVLGEVQPDGAAALQGLQTGDRIVAINGQMVTDWLAMTRVVRANPEVLLHLDIERQGQRLQKAVMPQGHRDDMGSRIGQLGIRPQVSDQALSVPAEYRVVVQHGPLAALVEGAQRTARMSWLTLEGMVKMVRGMIGLDNLSGPVTIARIAGRTAEMGWQTFLEFMAMMSISLGVLNLLPIPVLDGGHLLYYLAEGVRGRPLSERLQALGMRLGLGVLGAMMLVALFNDFSRLF